MGLEMVCRINCERCNKTKELVSKRSLFLKKHYKLPEIPADWGFFHQSSNGKKSNNGSDILLCSDCFRKAKRIENNFLNDNK
ncbi:MAG: hypothetical protein V5A64_06490 [Candidatus Thermoplasmatota archaeon]